MADWPPWAWVLIAVIALLIIVAIIFGTRRKDDIDPDGPFAQEEHRGTDPLTPRRGVAADTGAGAVAADPEPAPAGRRAEDPSHASEDEETLTGPLAVPDDAVSNEPTPADPGLPPDGAPEDFAAEAPAQSTGTSQSDWAEERIGETAGDPPPQRPEDDFAPDEPVAAAPDGMASENPESHFEPPVSDEGEEVEPESVADEGRAVEAVPETAPAPAGEAASDDAPPVDVGSPDDNDPPEMDFTPPKHADGTDYGEPVHDVDPDDDVPRDDLGRRLDPYGNPVD